MKYGYLVTCPIEFKNRLPTAVSLTAKTCDFAENKIAIIDNQPIDGVKKSFGVCCKYLFFEDRKEVIRFIEWVELLRILGAEKIMLFNKHVHPEHFKIMNYYKEKGIIDFYDYLDPSGLPNDEQSRKVRISNFEFEFAD
jgi:hypothetical protein